MKHARCIYDEYHRYDFPFKKLAWLPSFLITDEDYLEKFQHDYIDKAARPYGFMLALHKLGIKINPEILQNNENTKTPVMVKRIDEYVELIEQNTYMQELLSNPNFLHCEEAWPYDISELFPADLEPWELVNMCHIHKHPGFVSFSTNVFVWLLSGIPKEMIMEKFKIGEDKFKLLIYDAVGTLKNFLPMRLWIYNVAIEEVLLYTEHMSIIEAMEYRSKYHKNWIRLAPRSFEKTFYPRDLESETLSSLPKRPPYSRRIAGDLVISPPMVY